MEGVGVRARRLILGGVFTPEHFLLAMEAVKITQNGDSLPRSEDGHSVLREVVFENKDSGKELRFLCGFEKEDAVVYFADEWMAKKEYGNVDRDK